MQRAVPQLSGRARTARRDRRDGAPPGGRYQPHAPVPLHRPPLLPAAPSVQPVQNHGPEAPAGGQQEGRGFNFFNF